MYNPNSSTITGEQQRNQVQKTDKNANTTLQQRLGTITSVHDTLPMVKVTFPNGNIAGGDNWIPVGHSVLDIIHRFGALRNGLRVMVTFSGDVERDAIAMIVGVEDEKIGSEIQQENDSDTGYFELFVPGSPV